MLHFDSLNKPTGVKRVYLASKNSFRALKWLTLNESAFRQECLLLAVGIFVVAIWQLSLYESMALLISLLFVMFAEIVNTAIEAIIDRVGLDIHPLSGLAKDLGSLAVLVSMLIAFGVWLSILIKQFI